MVKYGFWDVKYSSYIELCICFINKVVLINLLPYRNACWCLCSGRRWKTLWQKRKSVIMSDFSFFYNVFKYHSNILFMKLFYLCCLAVYKVVISSKFTVCREGLMQIVSGDIDALHQLSLVSLVNICERNTQRKGYVRDHKVLITSIQLRELITSLKTNT